MKKDAVENIVKGYFRRYPNEKTLIGLSDGTVYFDRQKNQAKKHAESLGLELHTFQYAEVFAGEIKAEKEAKVAIEKAEKEAALKAKAEQEAKAKAEKEAALKAEQEAKEAEAKARAEQEAKANAEAADKTKK